MTRPNKVTFYVNDEELSRLDREADDRNMSRSGYVLSAIQRQWKAEDADEAADRMNAEEKVEQIVADARDELVGIARDVEQRNEDVADMTARAGSYSIANFELLKDEFDPAEVRKAETLLTGSRRLREPLDEHPDRDLDVDEIDENGETDGSSDASEGSTDAGNLIQELRDKRDSEEKRRERVERDHASARRELRKRKRRKEERNSGLSGLFDR
jgi:hypothetical protein